ncbi:hypothetical protein FHL15_008003 [Xylaria flabelliformis]|uniref:Uncharacterized protein n=1 Tax=Xylaria flabelliformis TaxID=2512241 RepID=A0A553HSV1_9PEZI|nr:hypothetical protein FHL15_008003 [Xylaria flabelliformis]
MESRTRLLSAACSLREVNCAGQFYVPHYAVASALRALPTCCTSLEIDLSHSDRSHGPPSVHLCEELREVMLRMKHVRLRLATMCLVLFFKPLPRSDAGAEDGDDNTGPAVAPRLKRLILDCSQGTRGSDGESYLLADASVDIIFFANSSGDDMRGVEQHESQPVMEYNARTGTIVAGSHH